MRVGNLVKRLKTSMQDGCGELDDATALRVEPHACCYKKCWERIQDATALRRGASRLLLQEMLGTDLGCHGLVPWRFTFVATRNVGNGFRMPRPCAVEPHACCYKKCWERIQDATALRR